MKHKKHPLRLFLFALLLLCFLTGLTGIARSPRKVEAAPQMQGACTLIMVEWTFDPTPASTTNPAPSTANVVASASQSGVGAVGYQTTGSHSGNAWKGNAWSQTSTITSYFEFDVSTVGYRDVSMSLWASRTDAGPQNISVQYSTDGTTFTEFNTYTIPTSVAQISIDFSSIMELDNNANAKFRIYGINASASAGNLRIDDVIFMGCPVVIIDSIVPNPTNDGTIVNWHSDVNGTYELRLGGTACTDGTLVDSGTYSSSPSTISFSLDGGLLTEGANTIHVCVTDSTAFTHFAVSSVTKDTTTPSVTINQASGQADPTGAAPINFTVVFSESVTGFDAADVNLSASTASGTLVANISGTGPTYTVGVSGMTGNGDVIAFIPANAVTDAVGNNNTASTTSDNTVTYAPTAPLTVIINEVAWAGTSSQNSTDEWIELYNPGTLDVDITGWRLHGDNNTLNQIGDPDITLSGTIPAGGYFLLERVQEATSVSIPANQVYSSGDLRNGGERLYLKDTAGNIIDTANSDGGAWPAGIASPSYASMERVGTSNTWVTYAGTVSVADDRSGNPIKGTPGAQNWIRTATVTTITSDTPDPSLVNQNVTVRVTVVGGTSTPTGTVAITGANTNCTMTLTNGSGSCVVKFSSVGTKTIRARYNATASHPASEDTESHQVSTTTATRTPTRVPTAAPAELVAINEFVPRPGHDWNNDGEVNVQDEYIEIINHGTINVTLSGYSLDDEVNLGSSPYRLPAVVIKPGERIVFYGSETGLLLSDGGDGVRLLKPNGQLMDAYNYTVARYPDQGYCRLPDNGGLDDWNQNCYPTPGLPNSLSGEFVSPTGGGSPELLCPIADTLPDDFVFAECSPYGSNIWRRAFWDATGWYGEKILPGINGRWDVFAD